MPTITAHCLVKNEENFIAYAIKSVIDDVDHVIVFDTGSQDGTVRIIQDLQEEYPDKITFEEKGECDKERHTRLRNEMVQKTKTDWFMILDGDEVWSEAGMGEAVEKCSSDLDCLTAPFYLCVGDVYHHSKKGQYNVRGKEIHATPRFFKNKPGLKWLGQYGADYLADGQGNKIFEGERVEFLKNKFWHLSHLDRSLAGANDYSSGGVRARKIVKTYFLIGEKIHETIPEVFLVSGEEPAKLPALTSFMNFFSYGLSRLGKK